MHGMKLFAAPLVFAVRGQAFEFQSFFPDSHFLLVDARPLPVTVNYRITKCAAVWSADFLSIVEVFVAIGVTLGA